MRTFTTVVVIGTALLAGGCVDRGAQQQAKRTQQILSDERRPVRVEPVRAERLVQELEITGQLTTSDDVEVGARQAGRIVAVYVREGDSVRPGQVIAAQETATLQAQLRGALASLSNARSGLAQALANASIGPSRTSAALAQAQAQLRSAQAQLKKARAGARPQERTQAEWAVRSAKSNLETAKKELDRTEKLVEAGAIPRQRLEQAQNAHMAAQTQYEAAQQSLSLVEEGTRAEDVAVAREAVRQAEEAVRSARAQKQLDVVLSDQVQSARANVQAAQAQVDIAREAIAEAQIRAPFGGKISGRPVQPGTMVGGGTPVARIVGAAGIYFEGQVPESQIALVRPGASVRVSISALRNAPAAGVVAAVAPSGADVGRSFTVRVQLGGSPPGVRPGMFAKGTVELGVVPSATVVPQRAVVTRGGREYVFVVEGSVARRIAVSTGLRSDAKVQVSGVALGQQVVVQGQESLDDGTKVQIERPAAAGREGTGGA